MVVRKKRGPNRLKSQTDDDEDDATKYGKPVSKEAIALKIQIWSLIFQCRSKFKNAGKSQHPGTALETRKGTEEFQKIMKSRKHRTSDKINGYRKIMRSRKRGHSRNAGVPKSSGKLYNLVITGYLTRIIEYRGRPENHGI